MANPEHIELVKQGAKAVNKFTAEHPDVTVDLSGADLSGRALRGALFNGIGTGEQRVCISPNTFQNAHWDRQRIEDVLRYINLNPDWEVRYQIVPKGPEGK